MHKQFFIAFLLLISLASAAQGQIIEARVSIDGMT